MSYICCSEEEDDEVEGRKRIIDLRVSQLNSEFYIDR